MHADCESQGPAMLSTRSILQLKGLFNIGDSQCLRAL